MSDQWLREQSPHLFDPCDYCGVLAKDHPDERTETCPPGGHYHLSRGWGHAASSGPLPEPRHLRSVKP